MCDVLPGVAEILARFFCSHSMLMSDYFPTLLRPVKAYSGKTVVGQSVTFVALRMNSAEWIITIEKLFG